MTREANAGGRKAAGNRDTMTGPSAGRSRITGRTGLLPDPKGADAGQVSLCRNTDNDPEPKDKLDNMTTTTPAASASLWGVGVLNGPEDEPTDWSAIDSQTIEQDVRRLRQRIFTCLLYTSSPRDRQKSRMPSSA